MHPNAPSTQETPLSFVLQLQLRRPAAPVHGARRFDGIRADGKAISLFAMSNNRATVVCSSRMQSSKAQPFWTVLKGCALFALQVISDLADPSEGVYSSAAAMEERLEYTDRMLERHQRLPIIPEPGLGHANAETNAYLNRRPAGVAVTKEDIDGREVFAGISWQCSSMRWLYPVKACQPLSRLRRVTSDQLVIV